MPDKAWIACGASAALIVASFFLSGFHHEVKHRWRARRYGGYIR